MLLSSLLLSMVLQLPERIYAAPDIECNIYYGQITDAVKPDAFFYATTCNVGKSMTKRWCWTPAESDVGRDIPLMVEMWGEEGVVATAKTIVHVARKAKDKTRKVTLALLGDSSANCRFHEALYSNMMNFGWMAYTPVGTRSGDAAQYKCNPGEVPHDCIGGYSFKTMMTRYYLMMDEVSNIEERAEREQLKHLGLSPVPSRREYTRALSRSPILNHKKGKVINDVQSWFDKMNGGQAPDVIMVKLGINRVIEGVASNAEQIVASEIGYARKMFAVIRKAAPMTLIAVVLPSTGCCDQDAFAMNYGSKFFMFQIRRDILIYHRQMTSLVKELGDPRMVVVPVGQNVDPYTGYIYMPQPYNARANGAKAPWKQSYWQAMNALHADLNGGQQIGDALAAWLMDYLAE